jgi:transcription elongation factor GreA
LIKNRSAWGGLLYIGQEIDMPPSFLTLEGYQKLQEELEYLRTIKRQEVANRLHEAMEGGELIEDAEYEAAKNEQAFVEGRIQELEILLANARVIEDTGKREVIQVGAKVTIQENENEPEVYTIVGPAEANPRNGRISNESPLGRALMEHRAGDVVKIDAPGGAFTVHVLKVE